MSARAGYVVLAVRGELDVCTAAEAVRALMTLAAAGAWIIVDLSDLAFIDCNSLHQLASARARARRAGGDLLLASPQPLVLRLLYLTGLIDQRVVFTGVDEAVSGAGSAPLVRLMPQIDRRSA
jgi:anti-anti-sigma factor